MSELDKLASARARVQFTIEIDAGSAWDQKCPMNQIYEAAAREAKMTLERIFKEAKKNVKFIDKPKVFAVITTENES